MIKLRTRWSFALEHWVKVCSGVEQLFMCLSTRVHGELGGPSGLDTQARARPCHLVSYDVLVPNLLYGHSDMDEILQ